MAPWKQIEIRGWRGQRSGRPAARLGRNLPDRRAEHNAGRNGALIGRVDRARKAAFRKGRADWRSRRWRASLYRGRAAQTGPQRPRGPHDHLRRSQECLREEIRPRRGAALQGDRAAQQASRPLGRGASSAKRAPTRTPMPRASSWPISRRPATRTCCARSGADFEAAGRSGAEAEIRRQHDRADGQGRRGDPGRALRRRASGPPRPVRTGEGAAPDGRPFRQAPVRRAERPQARGSSDVDRCRPRRAPPDGLDRPSPPGAACRIPRSPALLAREDFDAVTLDMQHGAIDLAATLRAIPLIAAAGKPAIARIPVGEFATASRLLDAGVSASSRR